MVQWVRLQAPNVGGPGSIPGQGTRSHIRATTKSPHAATKRSCVLQLRPGAAKINKYINKIFFKKLKKKLYFLILWLPKGEIRRDKLGVWDEQIHTIIHKIDKQQGPTVWHRELYSVSCSNL